MRLIQNSELKMIQMDIMDDIHRFCLTTGIRYSLAYGTLLGAVRHKGYIPWDDDIDIMMPRPDYERFINKYVSSENELIILKNIDSCVEMFTKVSRKGTKMVDKRFGRSQWGVNIDVFPVDGCPSAEHQSKINGRITLLARICPRYKVIKKNQLLWFLKFLVKRTLYFYPHSVIHLKNSIDSISHCNPTAASLAGLLMEDKGRFCVNSSIFDSYVTLPFEGKAYCSVRNYDTVLKTLYGDYLTPPPPEKRVSLHQFDVYINS